MAVKKTTKKKDESAAPTKAEAKETAPKKSARPKSTATTGSASSASSSPSPSEAAASNKAAAPKSTAPKGGAKKAAAAPIKLSPSQQDLLKRVGEAAEPGYTVAKKIEERSIQGLLDKKLIKRGAKDKASGSSRYLISSAGKKHLGSA